jgi:iron complex transport system substrate-binding protein
MNIITDARGNDFPLAREPKRIVSLVPSTTETLYEFGLEKRIVGVTRYCVHPASAKKDKIIVGGTKQINIEHLQRCRADLVLTNQEENSKAIVEEIKKLGIPCYVSFPQNVDQALQDMENLGKLLHREEQARQCLDKIRDTRNKCRPSFFRYAYLIWRHPWMTINNQTFISSMLSEIGGENIFSAPKERYLECSMADIKKQNPDIVFLSSEPYPFKKKHIQELIQLGFQEKQIQLIDGEMCSWHGIRMVRGFSYLQKQIIP